MVTRQRVSPEQLAGHTTEINMFTGRRQIRKIGGGMDTLAGQSASEFDGAELSEE